jgi:hypothetical protein
MNLTELRLEVRDITNTDTESFNDVSLDRKLNIEYKSVVSDIMQANGNTNDFVDQAYIDIENAKTKTEGELGYNGEYPLPMDCLVPLRVEVKFKQSQKPMVVYDQSQNNHSEFIESDLEMMPKRIRFVRNSIFVRPLPTEFVKDGLFIEYVSLPEDLSEVSDEPEFSSLFHDVLILATADRYYLKHPEKYNSKIEKKYMEKRMLLKDFFHDRIPKNLNVNGLRENWD